MRVSVVFLVVLLAGCDVIGIGRECTDELRFGLNVNVVDEATGNTIRNVPITATARDGSFVETHTVTYSDGGPVFPLSFAGERAGIYTVEVSAPGYVAWSQSNIRVREDGCHVQPVTITARLRRS